MLRNREKVRKFIREKTLYWAKRFKLNIKSISQARSSKFVMFVNCYKKNWDIFFVKYHMQNLLGRLDNYDELLFIIFHELGHLFHRAFYDTVGRVEAEYLAETFAVRRFKKYFPKKFKKLVKRMAEHQEGNRPVYYEKAWDRIKEYKPYREGK